MKTENTNAASAQGQTEPLTNSAAALTDFKHGDHVTFTKVTQSGGSINFASRRGVVVKVGVKSENIYIKGRNGRGSWIHMGSVRHEGKKNSLTECFENVAKAMRAEGGAT